MRKFRSVDATIIPTPYRRLNAAIIPAQESGYFLLRTKLIDIQDLFFGLFKESPYRLASPFEARYDFGRGEIQVCVDVRNGKVFKIIVSEGYRGLLIGKIKVGMLVREAMALEPALYYHEPTEIILHRSYPGVGMEVDAIDPYAEAVPDMCIAYISVFIPELHTLDGHKGLW